MEADFPDTVTKLYSSEYIQQFEQCKQFNNSVFFPLAELEIESLHRNGNSADNWSLVQKIHKSPLNTDRIKRCSFKGRVALGSFANFMEIDGVKILSGCYNSIINCSIISDDALLMDNFLVSNSFIGCCAAVIRCGMISCPEDARYGNGESVKVGIEIGGREIAVFADIPFDLAVNVGRNRSDTAKIKKYSQNVAEYTSKLQCGFNIISAYATLVGCSKVKGVFIGKYTSVSESILENSSILSSQAEKSSVKGHSDILNSIIQWNCSVESQSIVRTSLLCDSSHVERHAKVLDSIVGPNTSIAEGEVTSSFVGPFVGFHHQALLIASFWPEGKGNVGYGANVGSNHTLKAPDQELWPGEGVFFGLGSNIKFPSNFIGAPYSVIATGVNTLPQKVTMPFSLINIPSHSIPQLSPAINEITPGWVLAHSIFTVLRNEMKFGSRNKSNRTSIDSKIFRKSVINLIIEARKSLLQAEGKAEIQLPIGEPIYTDKEVKGIGKNYMTETSRKEAVKVYTFYIRLYALEAMLLQLEGIESSEGEFSAALLQAEFGAEASRSDLLKLLVEMVHFVASNAAEGKSRDDARGKHIIPDYAVVHKKASEENVVIQAYKRAEDIRFRASKFVPKL